MGGRLDERLVKRMGELFGERMGERMVRVWLGNWQRKRADKQTLIAEFFGIAEMFRLQLLIFCYML